MAVLARELARSAELRRGQLYPETPQIFRNATGWDAYPTPSREYRVRVAGSVVELVTELHADAKKVSAKRGAVTGFSGRSRRSLFKFCAALNWQVLGTSYFVTLTYPGEYPSDGRAVKRDLDNFRRAWAHRYGSCKAIWKQEFQRRGAPHFHLAVVGVEGQDLAELRAWVASTWFRVVSSGDDRHLLAGTQVQVLEDEPAAYFAGYVGSSKGSKEYQHVVPEGYHEVGRFWGAWGIRPEWREESVRPEEWVELRRMVYKLARSRGRFCYRPGRIQGQWYHARGSSALLTIAQLSRALPRRLFVT